MRCLNEPVIFLLYDSQTNSILFFAKLNYIHNFTVHLLFCSNKRDVFTLLYMNILCMLQGTIWNFISTVTQRCHGFIGKIWNEPEDIKSIIYLKKIRTYIFHRDEKSIWSQPIIQYVNKLFSGSIFSINNTFKKLFVSYTNLLQSICLLWSISNLCIHFYFKFYIDNRISLQY